MRKCTHHPFHSIMDTTNPCCHSVAQRSKINRSKVKNASKKISKKANRSKANKTPQSMSATYSRDYTNTHRDLRSSSVLRKRERARKYKYYNFSVVKAGQLSVPHYETGPYDATQGWPAHRPVDLTDFPIVAMSKKNLYQEAQRTAPFRCNWDYDKFYIKNAHRHGIEARRMARGLNSKGEYWDYSGLDAHCLDDYLKENWGVWDDYERCDETLTACDYGSESSLSCQCDDCVWARYGWMPSEDDQDWYEGAGTKTPEDSDTEEWTGWFETWFDQGFQLFDAALEKRSVHKEVPGLGWVNAVANAEETSETDWDAAGWFGLWDADWNNVTKAESEYSFEML
jgi:hypothetical protein